jgi:hypothetical protein
MSSCKRKIKMGGKVVKKLKDLPCNILSPLPAPSKFDHGHYHCGLVAYYSPHYYAFILQRVFKAGSNNREMEAMSM